MRLRFAVASPESIRRRSSGVVVSPEDLFDPAIFGPPLGPDRFGHLELAHPCLHPAFTRLAAAQLGLTHRALRRRLAARGAVGLRETLADASPILEALPVPPRAQRLPGSRLDAAYRSVLAARGSPASLQKAVSALLRLGWRERPSRSTRLGWTTWEDHPVVPDPSLGLDECGLPEPLAREQAEPLLARGLSLEVALRDRALLLVAPGAGGLACRPRLVEDGALRLHPLALAALGVRFGEARLGVHLALTERASREALSRLRPSRQTLSPATGRARLAPTDELALACWRLTWLHPREAAHQELRAFASAEEVLLALALGEVHPGERLALRWRGRRLATTAGRVAFNSALPPELQFVDAEVNQRRLRELVGACHDRLGERATMRMLESLTRLAAEWATRLAFSLGKDDLCPPPGRDALLGEAMASVAATQAEYEEGLLTDGERYNRTIDIWSSAVERTSSALVRDREERRLAGRTDLLFTALYAGVGGGTSELRKLAGVVGITSKPSEELEEVPVLHSLGEGLEAGEFFRTASRTRQLRDRSRARQAARLHRHLRESLGDLRVVGKDCGDRRGLRVEAIEAGELRHRLLGRVLAEEVLGPAGVEVTPALAVQLEAALDGRPVRIRSPLTCAAREGVCAACYGRSPTTGRRASAGERVGLLAALAIASELRGLRFRTFHIGGCNNGLGWGLASSGSAGTVSLEGGRVTRRDGAMVATSAWVTIAIVGPGGAELERHEVPRGAELRVRESEAVQRGARLAEWDPNARVVLGLAAGHAALCDLVPEQTLFEGLDEVTGLTRRVVRHTEGKQLRPRVEVRDATGVALDVQHLPEGAVVLVREGESVGAGDALARTPVSRTYQRFGAELGDEATAVERLLCAWRPEQPFLLATAPGKVVWLAPERGPRLLRLVGPEGLRAEYRIERGRHVSVGEGDEVRAGEVLCDGEYDPHQVLATLGPEVLSGQLLESLLDIFGLALAPVHLELALRQMLREARGDEPRLLGLGPVGAELEG